MAQVVEGTDDADAEDLAKEGEEEGTGGVSGQFENGEGGETNYRTTTPLPRRTDSMLQTAMTTPKSTRSARAWGVTLG